MNNDFWPKYIYWEICNHCNLKCEHCFANCEPKKTFFINVSLLLSKINEINQRKIVPIRLGGGEPFLHPDINKVLDNCYKHKIPVSITTNGTLLDEKTINMINTYKLETLTISIDGLQEYNDYLRGKGNFIRAYKGVRRALDNNINVSLAFTITATNYVNLNEYINYFYDEGIRNFYLFRYIPDEINLRSKSLELDKEKLYKVAQIIKSIEKKYSNIKLNYEKLGFLSLLLDDTEKNISCKFTRGIMTIRFDGTVVVCAAISKKLGNIYTDSLQMIMDNIVNEMNFIEQVSPECKGCKYILQCKGGCKSYSYNCYRDYLHKDNCCFKALIEQ